MRLRAFLFGLLALLWVAVPAPAQTTKANLITQLNACIYRNTQGAVTPQCVNAFALAVIASMCDVAKASDCPLPAGVVSTLGFGALATQNSLLPSQCPTFGATTPGCVPASGGSANAFLNGAGGWTTVPLAGSVPIFISNLQGNGFPLGNDANPCTQAAPCLTLDHALAVASAGQVIYCNSGTYAPTAARYNLIVSVDIEPIVPFGCVFHRNSVSRIFELNSVSGTTVTFGAVVLDGQNIARATLPELVLVDVGSSLAPGTFNFNGTKFINYGRYGLFEQAGAHANYNLTNWNCTSPQGASCLIGSAHGVGSLYSYGMVGTLVQDIVSSQAIAIDFSAADGFVFTGPFNLDLTVASTGAGIAYGISSYDTPNAVIGCGTGAPGAACATLTMHGTPLTIECTPALFSNDLLTPVQADNPHGFGVKFTNDCGGGGKGGFQDGFDGNPDGHGITAMTGSASPYTITAANMPVVPVGTVVTLNAHALEVPSLAGQYTVTSSSLGVFTATTTATGTWTCSVSPSACGYILMNTPVVGYHSNHARFFGNTSTNGPHVDASNVVEGGQFCGYESDCQMWGNTISNTDYGLLFKACLQCFAWGNTGTGMRRPFIDIKGIATGSGFFNNTNYETAPIVASLPFTASIATNVLTVTVPPTPTDFRPGMVIAGAGITGSPTIAAFGTGGTSGTGGAGTYQLSASFTIISEPMTAATNTSPAGIAIENDQFGQPSTGATFGNNNLAFSYSGANNRTFINDGSGDAGNTATFLHSNYYNAGASTATPFSFNSLTYPTLAAWQATFEPTATGVDPQVINPNGYYCGLASTSALLASGTAIAPPITTGADGIPFVAAHPTIGAIQWSGILSSFLCHP